MRGRDRLWRYGAAAGAGLAAFLLWRWLAGPSLHWIESLIGLALAIAAAAGLLRFLHARLGP